MKSTQINIGDNGLASQYNNLREDAKGAGHLLTHEQTTPDLTLKVEAGVYYISSTRVAFAGGNSPSFTAPSANPRIDLLVIDSAGTLSRVIGTEAASPSIPTYPTDKIVICEVYNRVGQTTIRDTDTAGQGYIQRDTRPFLRGDIVLTTSDQTINGIKTFGSLPVLPSSDPTTDNQAARKKYVDDRMFIAGIINAYGGSSAPGGWLLCDGAAVSRTTYAVLFGIIGTTFGVGDGSTTFNLPDLRGRFPLGKDNMGGSSANRVTATEADNIGQGSGAEKKNLQHNHPLSFATENNPGANGTNTKDLVTPTGNGLSTTEDVMNPYLTINYIIKI